MRIHNRTQVGSYLRECHKTSEASRSVGSFVCTDCNLVLGALREGSFAFRYLPLKEQI